MRELYTYPALKLITKLTSPSEDNMVRISA